MLMNEIDQIRQELECGQTCLGIELGSTRIKATLIDSSFHTIADGNQDWQNQLVDGIWTYSLDSVWENLQKCVASLMEDVWSKYGIRLRNVGAIGISAMMHGYMAFNKSGELLVPFRTWRNTITDEAAKKLTDLFSFNIPQRWCIAHLYQAMLNGEPHVTQIDYLTTLAGYIHWQLTGSRVIGVGDASGIFPIDSSACDYNAGMEQQFNSIAAEKGYPWKLTDILPKVLTAGQDAGKLTQAGANLLDPTGTLRAGIPFCPPEGDAGTGMVATNSIKKRTGNVSAGTSIFAMVVLENALQKVYPEIDLVTTPVGEAVAMVHCNNCTSDIDAWVKLFLEFAAIADVPISKRRAYDLLYNQALKGDTDCGGLVSFNYFSGEPITGFDEGRPLLARFPDADWSLANFMRAQLYSACATLRLGMDILFSKENVHIESITGHGGFFKTQCVGQRIMAAALNTPITLLETAGEGGPWGMAVLAAFLLKKRKDESLSEYLDFCVFQNSEKNTVPPDTEEVRGFNRFLQAYKNCLPVEKEAVLRLSR
ncbi:FGGY-family carbohydrate kinase [Caproiciproducens sp. AGMB10547]|uniref:FGGY-family carbohydrate kinase n=2 Tax=Caproiciproducens faecalis TaxID=2820301 RepID=A0ABS7DKX2_9FIRM|nr:FGGY-family carbohydrate kinase [Caproiciproducens faecalis]